MRCLFVLFIYLFCQFPIQCVHASKKSNIKLSDQLNKEGIAFVQENNYEMAKLSFLRAAELDQSNPQRWSNLGRAQFEVGEYEDAVLSLKQGLSLSPNDKMITETLSQIEQTLGIEVPLPSFINPSRTHNLKVKRGKQNVKESEKLNKEGVAFVQQNYHRKARDRFEKSVSLDYDNPQRWSNLGRAQFEVGEYEDAVLSLKQGLSLSPNDKMIRETLLEVESKQRSDSMLEVDFDPSGENQPKQNSQFIMPKRNTIKKDPKSLRRPKLPSNSPALSSNEGSDVVECLTTKGNLYIEVFSAWAPIGAARFLELVNSGFFSSNVGLFRVVPNWVAQFGISGNVSLSQQWDGQLMKDDPQWLRKPRKFNKGFISFAGGGPNTRNTQLFIALGHTPLGDAPHEVPFGRVITPESFKTMAEWYSGYVVVLGSYYLEEEYPQLDYLLSCQVMSSLNVNDVNDVKDESAKPQKQILPNPHRIKDVDYHRTIPAPPLQLPRYYQSSARTYHPDSHEHSFFWWLPALRANMERVRANPPPQRYNLNPNEVHVVEDFLSKEERANLRQMTLRLGERESETIGDVKTVYETSTNNAKNLVAFPPVFEQASEADKQLIVDTVARVSAYANENLFLNGTLGGDHNFSDTIGVHLGIFAIYEYLADVTSLTSRVSRHTDTDYDGRCLSAGLHLDNWGQQTHASPQKPTTKKKPKREHQTLSEGEAKYENVEIEGGVFQVMKCVDRDCSGAAGKKLGDLHEDFVFYSDGQLEVTEEASYEPGRLVFFLPETPHTVTPLTKNTRAILFMWFNCVEFDKPPQKNSEVEASISRFEAKVKKETRKVNIEKLKKLKIEKKKNIKKSMKKNIKTKMEKPRSTTASDKKKKKKKARPAL